MKKLILLTTILALLSISFYGCEKDTSINEEIGNLVKIDVYVNDVKVDTPVHRNNAESQTFGTYNLGDYVLLEPICKAMGATYEVKEDCIEIRYKEKVFFLESRFYSETSYWVINDKVYVQFAMIRYAMDGSLKQDGKKGIYLYTKDYTRLDIPATLEECYKALDKELGFFTKLSIKNSSIDKLGIHHFGVGLWIRNTWLYPANNRIDKIFRDAGITSPDEMSSEIIKGYHYYLNGITYEIGSDK